MSMTRVTGLWCALGLICTGPAAAQVAVDPGDVSISPSAAAIGQEVCSNLNLVCIGNDPIPVGAGSMMAASAEAGIHPLTPTYALHLPALDLGGLALYRAELTLAEVVSGRLVFEVTEFEPVTDPDDVDEVSDPARFSFDTLRLTVPDMQFIGVLGGPNGFDAVFEPLDGVSPLRFVLVDADPA